MDYHITRGKILSSIIWKVLERGGTQGIQFLVMILLARLLLPEDFGLIVIVTIFITISSLIVESGFGSALIQKKDADEIDFSSIFYLNLVVASLLYFILYFSAPMIASFFDEPQLVSVLRILSLTLFSGAILSIQNAIISRNMQFKNLFVSSLIAVVLSGAVGIAMALLNFGIWALVAQQLIHRFMVPMILWFTVNWRPRLIFSITRIKQLYNYGWKLLVSSLIYTFYLNLQNLLIGKLFNPALLGFYNRGMQFPNIIVDNINGSIQNVMFPALSAEQDNKVKLKEMVRRLISLSTFIVFPMMVGLAVIAEPLIRLLLTEKWLPTVPFLQIFCIYYALWTVDISNLQAIKAVGRSDIYLKLEIIKIVVGLIILAITIPFGTHAMALGMLVNGIIAPIVDGYPNKKLLNYHLIEQWKDALPAILLSVLMGACIYCIKWLGLSDLPTILLQVLAGIIFYVCAASLLKLECFTYLLSLLRKQRGKKVSLEGAS
ncbi:lipopolysaccharide biosynthesis protein [Ureibacillus chungkukjangi]|uniref:lipopolysaccharide biosynthesis protein n=1 Tax=Ureibacillus chungkukjangi TaxID=1202712 RepID=UPI00384F97DD